MSRFRCAGLRLFLFASVLVLALSACSGSGNSFTSSPTLSSIQVAPASPSVAAGLTQQLTATGTLSNGSTSDLTDSVTWSSQNEAVATVSASGLVTGQSTGTAVITATSGSISGSVTMTVTAAQMISIAVTPSNPSLAAGLSQQLQATAKFTDGSTSDVTSSVTWSSQNTAVAAVSSSGLLTGKTVGTAVVTATSGSISASVTVTVTPAQMVTIAVNPSSFSLAAGLSQQLQATAIFTDGTTTDLTNSATWSSQNTAVATVSASGRVTGQSVGTAVITATSGSISGSATITVTPAQVVSIAVTPATATVAAGLTEQFTATATLTDGSTSDITSSANWTSATPSVATVDSTGLATSLVQGAATITATAGSVSGSATLTVGPPVLESITITPGPATMQLGASTPLQLTATGVYSDKSTQDLTSQVTWTAVNSLVASVNASGQASPLSAGYTTVTVTDGSISSSTALTVLATPRYFYVTSDSGRDISRLAIDANSGQPRYTGYLLTGDFNNVGVGCLSINPSGTVAYLTTQVKATSGTGYLGQISIYNITQSSGQLNFVSTTSNLSIALGCLQFAPDGKFAYAVSGLDNAGNQLGIFTVNSDASLTLDNTIPFPYSPMSLAIDPLGKFLYVDVLDIPGGTSGSSSVYGYSMDATTGALTSLTGSPFPLPTGTLGALSFHPSGNFLYVANANGNTVSAYTVNRQTGALSASPFSTITPCTNPLQLQISPDGAHAYESCLNQTNSIAAYAIAADGSLTQTASVNPGGVVNQIAVDPSGQYLYASMPDNDRFKLYKLGANGSVTFEQQIAGRNNISSTVVMGGTTPVQWTTTNAYVTSAGNDAETPYTVNSDGTLTAGTSAPTNTGPFSATMLPWDSYLLLATQAAAPNLDGYLAAGNSISLKSTTGTVNSVGGVVIDPNGNEAYASDPSSGLVYVYSGKGFWTSAGLTFTAGAGAGPVIMDPSGRYLIVANQTEQSISLIQPAGAAATPNVLLTYTPLALAIDPTGNFLFVAGGDGYLHMLVSDGQGNLNESSKAALAGNMQSVAVDPMADFVYAAGAGGLQAFSYDPAAVTLTPVSLNIAVPLTNATGVYVDPSGKFLYVSVSSSTTNALYLFTINSDGTLTASTSNPVANPQDATSMVFHAQVQ